ncbi:hypothetical protein PR048_002556 [Dryococelus australis]|uniref:Uncharacterized protein n=1 Tax=Dryococelus australis TaxID=614101 RepID=A0ABQ9IKI5_9NEOP|nr:hypothetical protein PR048_002556 [Dryococelus australis]
MREAQESDLRCGQTRANVAMGLNCPYIEKGRGSLVVRLIASLHGEPGSIPNGVTPIFACGDCGSRNRWPAGFLGIYPAPLPLHSPTASSSPHFTHAQDSKPTKPLEAMQGAARNLIVSRAIQVIEILLVWNTSNFDDGLRPRSRQFLTCLCLGSHATTAPRRRADDYCSCDDRLCRAGSCRSPSCCLVPSAEPCRRVQPRSGMSCHRSQTSASLQGTGYCPRVPTTVPRVTAIVCRVPTIVCWVSLIIPRVPAIIPRVPASVSRVRRRSSVVATIPATTFRSVFWASMLPTYSETHLKLKYKFGQPSLGNTVVNTVFTHP